MCSLLHKEGGHLYVCGDVRMAKDVAQAVKRVLAKNLHLGQQQAEDYFFQLKVCSDRRGRQTVLQGGLHGSSKSLSRSRRLPRALFQQNAQGKKL